MSRAIEVVHIDTDEVERTIEVKDDLNIDHVEAGLNRNMSDDYYTRQVER